MRPKGMLTMGTAFPRVPPRNDHLATWRSTQCRTRMLFFQRTAVVTKYRYVFLRLYVLFVCARYCSEMLRLKIRYNHCLENVQRRPRLRSASTEQCRLQSDSEVQEIFADRLMCRRPLSDAYIKTN